MHSRRFRTAGAETSWLCKIEGELYRRQGKAITNFEQTLPKPQSDLAQQLLKDPYNFDFLTLSQEAQERELEAGLLEHIVPPPACAEPLNSHLTTRSSTS